MNDKEHNEALTDEQRVARNALDSLPVPTAREEFRSSLRAQFLNTPVDRSADDSPSSVRPRRSRAPRRSIQLVAVPVAIAALLVLGLGLANRGPDWQVHAYSQLDHITVDGQRLSLDSPELAPAVARGGRVQVPEGGSLELLAGNKLLLQLEGGTAMTVPSAPGRWFGRHVHSEMDPAGLVRVTTGPGFVGSRYAIFTGQAEIEITGTTLTVINGESSTCVCVLEGKVRACPPGGSMESIESGRRLTFIPDQAGVDRGDMLPAEKAALTGLRTRVPAGFELRR